MKNFPTLPVQVLHILYLRITLKALPQLIKNLHYRWFSNCCFFQALHAILRHARPEWMLDKVDCTTLLKEIIDLREQKTN